MFLIQVCLLISVNLLLTLRLYQGLLCDLLWSDPDKDITGWSENDRGVSFTFGPDVVSRFLQKHDMDLICRAHQVRLSTSGNARGEHVVDGLKRWSKMDMNFSQRGSWSLYSRRRITAGSLIMLGP